ncbi:ATP synthase subunit d, mitochondrial-like [Littorina saxatilis]|uniref:ATP synthase subunit d, mitochondrial n=1 Tax=Littorina saxatilis TaxID=31220 RepID=A0AAN9BWN3_9CAEN
MAARRIAKSAVDWVAFKERVPARQQEFYRAFKHRNDLFVNKVHQYPAELPKIDFAVYKARLPNPALADEFQKAYEGLNIPYPADKSSAVKQIEDEEKSAGALSKAYIAERQAEISDAKLLLSKIDSLPKPEEMTMEMYAYYFPDLAIDPVKRPTFWPHIPNIQPGHKDAHNL